MLNPEYLRADWDKAKALEVFKVTILIVLEAILCSALGAVGIYFAFWPHEILIASLFIACMVIMLLHFRRTTQRTIKDLGFPLKVEMRRFE